MTDLFVYTADADAQAVFRSILGRHDSLGIRKITYEVDRHFMRDPGMVTNGPELVRFQVSKSAYQKVLLTWDYQGSNWSYPPEECVVKIQDRLDGVTWKNRSGALVIIPELEEWFWHNTASVCKLLELDKPELIRLTERYCKSKKQEHDQVIRTGPKELFEFVLYERYKRRPLPRDFEQIAKIASLRDWRKSASFERLVAILQSWFRNE